MDVTGKIIVVCPLQQGESAKGPWKSQDYVIEYYEPGSQYSRKMVFNVFGENIDKFAIQEGQEYTVSVDIDAREWNGRWFSNIRAWRVMSPQNTTAQAPQQAPIDAPISAMPNNMKTPDPFDATSQPSDASSDLPF
ncbi:MAG: DUF3127 domain-containing protein [Paludibacteraceae bacterium]|nr:DUF3127 domain-containing protein [Paludibacteraceae bacterium]MEE3483157.1 DUF3127 domain-containing protein [Bacteroidales bacterium]